MIYKYIHPEDFEDWEKTDFKEYNGKLVLWGAGKIGGMAAHCLKKQGVEILAFCDIAKDKWGTIFCGYKVISPEDLKRDYPDAAVIVSNAFLSGVYPKLEEAGFNKIFDCVSLFMEIDFEDYDFWMTPEFAIRVIENYLRNVLVYTQKKIFLERLLLIITTKCTLRCRNCDAYIPYIKSPKHFDSDIIIDSCKKVLDAVGYIRVVDVLGGEPLLHPELPKILKYLRDEQRIGKVNIISNGTIIPKQDLLEVLNSSKFMLRISDYGKLSSKKDEIFSLLLEKEIKYEVTNYTYWDTLPKIIETKETKQELVAKFKICTTNVFYVTNGILSYCTVVAGVSNLEEDIFPKSENNYLDLYSDEVKKDTKKKIMDFLKRMYEGKYIDACKYCSGSHCLQFENKVPVAEQTKELLTLEKLY